MGWLSTLGCWLSYLPPFSAKRCGPAPSGTTTTVPPWPTATYRPTFYSPANLTLANSTTLTVTRTTTRNHAKRATSTINPVLAAAEDISRLGFAPFCSELLEYTTPLTTSTTTITHTPSLVTTTKSTTTTTLPTHTAFSLVQRAASNHTVESSTTRVATGNVATPNELAHYPGSVITSACSLNAALPMIVSTKTTTWAANTSASTATQAVATVTATPSPVQIYAYVLQVVAEQKMSYVQVQSDERLKLVSQDQPATRYTPGNDTGAGFSLYNIANGRKIKYSVHSSNKKTAAPIGEFGDGAAGYEDLTSYKPNRLNEIKPHNTIPNTNPLILCTDLNFLYTARSMSCESIGLHPASVQMTAYNAAAFEVTLQDRVRVFVVPHPAGQVTLELKADLTAVWTNTRGLLHDVYSNMTLAYDPTLTTKRDYAPARVIGPEGWRNYVPLPVVIDPHAGGFAVFGNNITVCSDKDYHKLYTTLQPHCERLRFSETKRMGEGYRTETLRDLIHVGLTVGERNPGNVFHGDHHDPYADQQG